MKKYIKKIIVYIFLFVMLISLYNIKIIYCSGENSQIDKKNILQELSMLDNADKMIIETDRISLNLYQKIEIIDLKDIKYITNALKNSTQIDGIETICDYQVTFFNEGSKLLKFGLSLDLEYPDSSFIRFHDTDDYSINRSCYDFFVTILHLKTKK